MTTQTQPGADPADDGRFSLTPAQAAVLADPGAANAFNRIFEARP